MLLPRETDGLITKRLCRISVAAPAKKRNSTHLKRWADDNDIDLRFIQPAKPSQNAYMERYNRTVRHEWLNQNLFESLEHARETATAWLWVYNTERPNSAIGGVTPRTKLAA